MKAIRNLYTQLGVERYYKEHGTDYTNPHAMYIEQLIKKNEERIDYTNVLDFCCGSGEVSLYLKELGYNESVGSDPFTQKAYKRMMGKNCLSLSFKDVIKGKLSGEYSSIICSFAMHLCEEGQLYPLVHQLFSCSPQLVIITPHKRPLLENIDGVKLDFEDFVLTAKGKKVRLKSYKAGF